MLVGYQEGTTNYRVYDPKARKVIETPNVRFAEDEMLEIGETEDNWTSSSLSVRLSLDKPDHLDKIDDAMLRVFPEDQMTGNDNSLNSPKENGNNLIQVEDENYDDALSEPCEDQSQLQEAGGEQAVKSRYDLRIRKEIKAPLKLTKDLGHANIVCLEPLSYEEAVSGGQADMWNSAIQEELDAHKKNST